MNERMDERTNRTNRTEHCNERRPTTNERRQAVKPSTLLLRSVEAKRRDTSPWAHTLPEARRMIGM